MASVCQEGGCCLPPRRVQCFVSHPPAPTPLGCVTRVIAGARPRARFLKSCYETVLKSRRWCNCDNGYPHHTASPPTPTDRDRKAESQEPHGDVDTVILVRLSPFGDPVPSESCSSTFHIEGCRLTADRNLYNIADAVLLHHRDIRADLSNLPPAHRPPFQKWVWMNWMSHQIILKKTLVSHNSSLQTGLSYCGAFWVPRSQQDTYGI
nr:PREDICTED: uncharacterized protein LOC107078908 [Lepisosteus oculatus]